VIAVADQFFELLGAQPFFIQIPKMQFHAAFLKRRPRFSAAASGGLVQKLRGFLFRHHGVSVDQ
jgi:hypothetical protein